MTQQSTIRGHLLQQALDITTNVRNVVYGDPAINLQCAGELKAIYAKYAGDKYCEGHDEAIEMVLTKLGRVATGLPGHDDTYIDAAAYVAIAAECQTRHMLAGANSEARDSTGFTMEQVIAANEKFALSGHTVYPISPIVMDDPINRGTALDKSEPKAPDTTYKHIPVNGMLFKTQESGVIVWEVLEVFEPDDHGMLWFRSAVYGRPAASLNPDHFRPRMPASAIHHVVAE